MSSSNIQKPLPPQPVATNDVSPRVLLIIAGGIAAYKSLDVIRRLRERGTRVRVVLTKAAQEFVTPLSATVLSGEEAVTNLFSPKDEAEIGHIQLSREADLILVAPASADLIAKMAHGLADDLATTALLATDTPVLVAPAMNVRMWEHAATQRNIATLKADGVQFVGPVDGAMACGEFGAGRMAEVDDIVNDVMSALNAQDGHGLVGALSGKRVLVTAGPTHEPIDPVRYIANRSSGKQGYAIAVAAHAAGADVTLISGPVAIAPPQGVNVVAVETARELLDAVTRAPRFDVGIFAAAVADWRTREAPASKMKKTAMEGAPTLSLVENPDILRLVAKDKTLRPELLIGFAAESDDVIAHAIAKRARKACDWIVANDISAQGALTDGQVMGGDRNLVHLVRGDTVETWPEMSKTAVAERLVREISSSFSSVSQAAE